VFTTEQSQQDTCVETIDQEINSVAIQWGFDVIRIMGDGNCFFTSVVFQVSQLLTRSDLQTHVGNIFILWGSCLKSQYPKLVKFCENTW
jgi:hypothetical protein